MMVVCFAESNSPRRTTADISARLSLSCRAMMCPGLHCRSYKFSDESRPFGFAWFLLEILRNGATFRDIIVAAIMLQVLALALPIFIQITVDKVLVHQAYMTPYVLDAGVGNPLRRRIQLSPANSCGLRLCAY
jgi:ABC-type bacteriocin/lantibiotic exporter with double-glycine peptidase domain